MPIDPTVISINGDRVSGQVQDLLRRTAVLERSGGAAAGPGSPVADATTTVKGKIQLAGHLDGTAAAPTLKTTAQPQLANLGLGQAANSYRLSFPVSTSATDGIDFGGTIQLYRFSASQLLLWNPTGLSKLRLHAADTGTLREMDLSFYDQESNTTPIWTIRKAAGSKPLQFMDEINGALVPFLLNRQDGSKGAAKFVSTFNVANPTSIPGATPGVDFQMPLDSSWNVDGYSQILGIRNLLHAGGHALISGAGQFADAGTLTVNTTAEAPASGTLKLRDDTGAWNTIAYTAKTGTTFTGCTGAAGHNAVAAGRAVTFPATAIHKSPITQSNEVTVAALQTPTAGLDPPNTSTDGRCEPAHYFGTVRDWTPAGSQHAQVWGFDTGVHGAVGEQQTFLANAVMHVNNHYNGSPSLTDSCGMAITTRFNLGAGGGAGPQLDATTYPVDCGIIVTGTTGATGSTTSGIGFTTGIRIGGSNAPWYSDAVVGRVDNGIEVRNFTSSGIKIWKRTSATTGAALILGADTAGSDSTASADGIQFGVSSGIVNLYRAASNILRTDDTIALNITPSTSSAVGLASSTSQPVATTLYMVAKHDGSLELGRTSGSALRIFKATASANWPAQPVWNVTAQAGTLQWGDGSAAVDASLSRTGVGELTVGSNLIATTYIATGTAGGSFRLTSGTAASHLLLQANSNNLTSTPATSDAAMYIKNGILVVAYNDGGTVRYHYMDMTGATTPKTWTNSTTAP